MSNKSDTKSRKYQLTFNNPLEYGYTHESINNIMKNFNYSYYCLCDEIGLEESTQHTHLYFVCENAVRFSKVKKLFASAHIEPAKGSSQDNRNYIRKEGKYQNEVMILKDYKNIANKDKKSFSSLKIHMNV